MNPSDVGIYDTVVVQELIKTLASVHQLDTSGQREFKGAGCQSLSDKAEVKLDPYTIDARCCGSHL